MNHNGVKLCLLKRFDYSAKEAWWGARECNNCSSLSGHPWSASAAFHTHFFPLSVFTHIDKLTDNKYNDDDDAHKNTNGLEICSVVTQYSSTQVPDFSLTVCTEK